ncbi:hypothetical protein MRB53_010537 [Persea americana]|uniref:Uncharacterized protein n=1 Tax=Persea americana TaxID=3435 RepID=A0ACC2LS43_PERAE|nr:hypothetical protein MRB53_010537 [Persea americana]
MSGKLFFKFFHFCRILHKKLNNPRHFYPNGNAHAPTSQLDKCPSLSADNLSNKTLVMDIEGALLRSSSPFPYFMLVAFEGGGLFRAFLLLLLYPLLCLVGGEMALKTMVMVSFCGLRRDDFRVGRAVLPKHFLEDVGLEGFQLLKRARRKVGVSNMPKVMVEGFLKEFLHVEEVVGRELKVVGGYYIGLMEGEKEWRTNLDQMFGNEKMDGEVVSIGNFNSSLRNHLKEIYLVTEGDKRNYHSLPRHKYPRPLLFHDGRLAFRPTPLATLVMLIWLPLGFILAIFRSLIALSVPYKVCIPILSFTGLRINFRRKPNSSYPTSTLDINDKKQKGTLYVCNHRTLLDPLYISGGLDKSITAVTYSLSRVSELLSPIKTVRLTRKREEDRKMMKELLREGDLVVCPEGTTCREPFLLRFSPLFAELSDDIVPVAMDSHVSMFYGTTASGFKCLDPLFFLMNPFPFYDIEVLEKVCLRAGVKSRFDVATLVQRKIGRALGFECTTLTRKDKYLMLAGNEGTVPVDSP